MRRVFLVFALTALCSLAVAAPAIAKRSGGGVGYTLVGSATLVSPGHNSPTGVQLTSTESGASLTWGAIGFAIAPGLRLRQVNTLATDYEFLDGSCWDGSPRFTVGVSRKAATTAETYFYIGPPPNYTGCPPGIWASTGNLATPSSPVDDSHLPGGSPYDTYADAQARYGDYLVKYIAIDLDGGAGGNQAVDFDNTQVNSTLYTYEP